MALQSSGEISMNNINVELGLSGTTTISLNDSVCRTLSGVASGAISLSNFYGKANAFTFAITIASNTTDYNLRNAIIAAGWNQSTALKGTVTINSGVYVYSTSTGTPAFSTGSLPAGSDVTVVNNGTILGRGGAGGAAGQGSVSGNPGGGGGTGFYATSGIKVTNNGRISGGGGGGGGGGSRAYVGGGGGGGGIGNGSAGARYYTQTGETNGTAGTLTSAGAGGTGGVTYNSDNMYWYKAGNGGSGGTYGSSGSSGGRAYYYIEGGPLIGYLGEASGGGGAGAAVVGNGYITWNATGTRNGAIS